MLKLLRHNLMTKVYIAMLGLLLLVAETAAPFRQAQAAPNLVPAAGCVIVYFDVAYGGSWRELCAGSYDPTALGSFYLNITSVQVGANAQVTLYAYPAFMAPLIVFDTSEANLGNYTCSMPPYCPGHGTWNDATRSIMVENLGSSDLAVDHLTVIRQDTGAVLSNGASVPEGVMLQLEECAKNIGAADVTTDFRVEYRDNGTFIDYDNETANISAGGGDIECESDTFTPAGLGQHTLRVDLDTTNVVAESNESNNSATFVVYVVALPDITFHTLTVTRADTGAVLAAGATIYEGTSIVLEECAKNLGVVDVTADFWVEYRDNGTMTDVDTETLTISGGGSDFECESDTFTLTGLGQHTLRVDLDTTNLVAESNESNNSATFVLNVVGAPDLAFHTLTVTRVDTGEVLVAGATIPEGTQMIVEECAKNLGTIDVVTDFQVSYFDNGILQGTDIETISILTGGTDFSCESMSFIPTGLGQHTLQVDLDTTNLLAESNENNNSLTFALFVVATPTPTDTPTATPTDTPTPTNTPTATPTDTPIPTAIPASASLTAQVTLQGRPVAPDPRWQIPVSVTLTLAGEVTPRYTYTLITDQWGRFALTDIEPGVYTITVKNVQTLRNGHTVTLISGANTADLGTLRAGDADNDNYVGPIDSAMLAVAMYSCSVPPVPNYDARADFNGDGCVNYDDFMLLQLNFNQVGD